MADDSKALMSNDQISKQAQLSTSSRATAFECILAKNGREVPETGVYALDLLNGNPITKRTLDWAIAKFSIRFGISYKQEVLQGQKLPNKVTELVEDAIALGWSDERFKQTVSEWFRTPAAQYSTWTPSHIIAFEVGDKLFPHSWYISQERHDRYRVEGFFVGGYPLYRFADGRDLEKEFGFKRIQSPGKSGEVDKPEDNQPITSMPDDVKLMLEEAKGATKMEDDQS